MEITPVEPWGRAGALAWLSTPWASAECGQGQSLQPQRLFAGSGWEGQTEGRTEGGGNARNLAVRVPPCPGTGEEEDVQNGSWQWASQDDFKTQQPQTRSGVVFLHVPLQQCRLGRLGLRSAKY